MTNQTLPPAPTWDLESIFPGGAVSPQFADFRKKLNQKLDSLAEEIKQLPHKLDRTSSKQWSAFILSLQQAAEELRLVRAFGGCLIAQNVADTKALGFASEGDSMGARWDKLKTEVESFAVAQNDDIWNEFVGSPELADIIFYLNELRENGRKKMSVELEALALDLSVGGYHGWMRLYNKMAGDIRVDFEKDGETKRLSLGQLAALMENPDRSIRKRAFEQWCNAWTPQLELAAMTINSQAAFRLALYDHRGWTSSLTEPLLLNRISQASLDAMWHVVARETPRLKPYIEAKKKLLGIDKFCWYDQFAICSKAQRKISFNDAVDFIIQNLSNLSNELAGYCRKAVDNRWVEAEDRSGKAAGAFCTTLGIFRQSRVFMTYTGSVDNLLTLAHELGHAYHGHVLKDKPLFAMGYPMVLAETASTFNEMAVTESWLANSTDTDEQLMLQDQTLMQAYTLFCDLHSRYLFDRSFYEERRRGVVGKERLNELMIDAQRRAFGDLLDESGYHPLFWCTKLHFFKTDVPFYNFPYTFGFLFANGIYELACREGKEFEQRYRALLADTGSMMAEDLARKHLGIDLTSESFWQSAVDRSLGQLPNFIKTASSGK